MGPRFRGDDEVGAGMTLFRGDDVEPQQVVILAKARTQLLRRGMQMYLPLSETEKRGPRFRGDDVVGAGMTR